MHRFFKIFSANTIEVQRSVTKGSVRWKGIAVSTKQNGAAPEFVQCLLFFEERINDLMFDFTQKRRGANRGRLMDYIPDRTLFAAVMFARKMIREGTPAGIANGVAANYYQISAADVGHYVGQAGGRSAQRRRRRKGFDR